MPAPSKVFTNIPDSDIDPESPITTGLMTSLRDNIIHANEQVSFGFVAEQAHNHDGVNSTLQQGNVMGNLFAFINYR